MSIKLCKLANFGDFKLYAVLIMRFYCQKDFSYLIYERSKTKKKKAARILRAMYNALSRHKFVGSTIRRTFEYIFCFDYSFYALHKEQQRFRLHEHCLMLDLARSTHAFMHVIREIDLIHLSQTTYSSLFIIV